VGSRASWLWAAVGNGNDILGVDTPAADPYVVSVGATDMGEKIPASLTTRYPTGPVVGNSTRAPDVAAPGTSLVSLRDPGSYVDQKPPRRARRHGLLQGQWHLTGPLPFVSGAAASSDPGEPQPDARSGEGSAGGRRPPRCPLKTQLAEGSWADRPSARASALPVPTAVQKFPGRRACRRFSVRIARRACEVDPGGNRKATWPPTAGPRTAGPRTAGPRTAGRPIAGRTARGGDPNGLTRQAGEGGRPA